LDILFNTLLGFVCLFFLAVILISENKVKTDDNNKINVEFLIIMTWNDYSADDVDLWVEDPQNNIVCFKNREAGLMHLDRDDVGIRNDIISTVDGQIIVRQNREVVAIRGIVPGEYIANVHMYTKEDAGVTEVTIKLDKINPFGSIKTTKVVLENSGDERTAFRFVIDKSGVVTSLNYLEKSLAKK